MEECRLLVERYFSAIEMAFTANLAVALWAILWNRFRKQHAEFLEAANALDRNENFHEKIGLRGFRKTLRYGLGVAIGLWWLGLAAGLISAIFLYILMWHESLCLADKWPLLLAAYTFPSVMVIMTTFGLLGYKLAANRMKELRRLEYVTSEDYKKAVAILQSHRNRRVGREEDDLNSDIPF